MFFEKERLFYDKIISRADLNKARINLLNYVNEVWNNQEYINNNIIINRLKKVYIIGNSYFSKDKEKIIQNYIMI